MAHRTTAGASTGVISAPTISFKPAVLGRRMRPDHAGQAVHVGHRQRAIAQFRRALHQLVRMRRTLQEGEIRFAVQFGSMTWHWTNGT